MWQYSRQVSESQVHGSQSPIRTTGPKPFLRMMGDLTKPQDSSSEAKLGPIYLAASRDLCVLSRLDLQPHASNDLTSLQEIYHMQRAGSRGCGAVVGKRRDTNNQRRIDGNAQPRDKDAVSNCVLRRLSMGQHDRRFNSVWRVGFFQGVRDPALSLSSGPRQVEATFA